MKNYKVIFADLDGTLIETESGKTFPKWVGDFKFKFDAINAIANAKPEYLVIVSNQGGISLGHVKLENFEKKFSFIVNAIEDYFETFNKTKIFVFGTFCDSNDKENQYRKPNTGMLETACHKLNQGLGIVLDKSDILMIGDASGLEGQHSDSDKKTAENFGVDYLDINEFIKQYGQ